MAQLIDFYADWCGPCKQQATILEDIEDAYDELDIEKIDVDENNAKASQYNVRSLPTLVLLDDDGNVTERFVGLTQSDDLEEAIEDVL